MHPKLPEGMLHKPLATWYLVFQGSCSAHCTSDNLKGTEALKCNKGVFYAFTISEWWVMHVDSSYNAISHGEPTKVSFFRTTGTHMV